MFQRKSNYEVKSQLQARSKINGLNLKMFIETNDLRNAVSI